MVIPRQTRIASRLNRLHYLIDALLGIESQNNPIILLTVQPKKNALMASVAAAVSTPTSRVSRASAQHLVAADSTGALGRGDAKPHQIMTIDRVRGRGKHGDIRMLEFSQAKNWEELEQTHLRLYQFNPINQMEQFE